MGAGRYGDGGGTVLGTHPPGPVGALQAPPWYPGPRRCRLLANNGEITGHFSKS